jgi:hypothetical protein
MFNIFRKSFLKFVNLDKIIKSMNLCARVLSPTAAILNLVTKDTQGARKIIEHMPKYLLALKYIVPNTDTNELACLTMTSEEMYTDKFSNDICNNVLEEKVNMIIAFLFLCPE